MTTNAQVFFDYLAAPATHLACVAWIDLRHTPPGTFSLVRCELDKTVPRRVCDGFGETMMPEHSAYVQLFKYDYFKSISQLSALLVGKVAAFVRYSLIYMRDDLSLLLSFWTAFLCRAQFLLGLCQSLFFRPEKARVLNRLASRKHGKRFQPHVYTYGVLRGRERLRFNFGGKASVPLTRRTARYRQRLNTACKRAMEFDFHGADLRQPQLTMLNSESGLRVGDAVVSGARTKARETRLLPVLEPAKECVKGLVQSPENVLQHLRVNHAQCGTNRFDFWQLDGLRVIVDRRAADTPCVSTFLQPRIVEFATKGERSVKFLRFARIDAIFISLLHLMSGHIC